MAKKKAAVVEAAAPNQISLETALEYYADASSRGRVAGATLERQRIVRHLQALLVDGPFDYKMKMGIKVALMEIRDLSD